MAKNKCMLAGKDISIKGDNVSAVSIKEKTVILHFIYPILYPYDVTDMSYYEIECSSIDMARELTTRITTALATDVICNINPI